MPGDESEDRSKRPRVGANLGPAEREELLGLIARHPGASDARICRLFFARTDRAITRPTVRRARARGYCGDGARGVRMGEARRSRLLAMIREAGPWPNQSEIARRFSAQEGRPVSQGTVSRLAREVLGLSRPGPGG